MSSGYHSNREVTSGKGGEQRWECYYGNRWSAFLNWVGDAVALTSNYLPAAGGFRHNVPGVTGTLLAPTYITCFISS